MLVLVELGRRTWNLGDDGPWLGDLVMLGASAFDRTLEEIMGRIRLVSGDSA